MGGGGGGGKGSCYNMLQFFIKVAILGVYVILSP